MTYVYAFDHRHDLPFPEVKALLGGKAANLSVMATELSLPVPPGFVITTEACKAYLAGGWPATLDAELREHMRLVEAAAGRRFGDPADPLLVSVRSGAPVSMPGMMDTILNLGLNEATEAGLAATSGDAAFAANCHARFRKMYREIVGTETVPGDPWLQLRGAVEAVFRSWNGDRAKTYRQREGIPDDMGTAVTVQTMVFGNRGADSGTGVLFTRNPATGEATIYGDIMFNAQGEDVVAGTHRTEPLAVLDDRMPAVGAELRSYAERLERHYADLCDIEFTIERGRLWMLQCRVGKRSPQAALKIAVDMAGDGSLPVDRAEAVRRVRHLLANPPLASVERSRDLVPLTKGLPASPGVASGEIATTPEAACDVADAGRPVILVRNETSPDDVHGMARSVGILTAQGGLASHAAVVARGWGIPAVVGAGSVQVGEGSIRIDGSSLAVGETITIDGSTGEVFAGAVAGERRVVPEAATLLGWAKELGVPIGEAEDAAAAAASASPETPVAETATVSADDVLRAMLVKGLAGPDGIAQMLLCPPETVSPLMDGLVAGALAEKAAGTVKLTRRGKIRAREIVAAEQERWGLDNAVKALDTFLDLDHLMKDIVTAWQMRDVDGEQVFNDHADADYDRRILGKLAALHDDTTAWLTPLVAGCPRMAAYHARLARALELAQQGDQRYVASPRVDSYHSVWFELHEDLILLAGRTRADEVAAGRA